MSVSASGSAGNRPTSRDPRGEDHSRPSCQEPVRASFFHDAEFARWQEQLRANPALAAAMASFEAEILDILDDVYPENRTTGPAPKTEDERPPTAPRTTRRRDGTSHGRQIRRTAGKGPHGHPNSANTRRSKRDSPNCANRDIAWRLLAAWLSISEGTRSIETEVETDGSQDALEGPNPTPDVGTYSNYLSNTEYVPTSDQNRTQATNPHDCTFVAPPRNSRPEWSCLKMGLQYNETAHPAGAVKRSPYPCRKCENCVRYTLCIKVLRFMASSPAPLLTVLVFKGPDPTAARAFESNRQHSRRLPGARRFSGLKQEDLQEQGDGSNLPCDGYLIWDGEVSQETIALIESHAEDCGMYNVNAYITAVDEHKFREWLPGWLSLGGRNGEKIDTTHFGRGWAKEAKPEKDLRGGQTRVKHVPEGGAAVTSCEQTLRAEFIEHSWRPAYNFLSDPALTQTQRETLRLQFVHLLHRARYINIADWLYCMSDEAMNLTKLCINKRLVDEEAPLKRWRQSTKAPQELIDEVVRWMMGEREPEPWLTLAAEKLGFISMLGEFPARHIAPKFLADLTNQLPPLLEFEGPRVPAHLTAAASDAKDVYSRLYANYPKSCPTQAPNSKAELAMAA